ncbi:hypothetical protein QVD17_30258 [Tagetes erecta]|uniref:Uncharacterized protein n=1 Tax=Tagetes erecta TaxID=13708 RepID=A0AAD8NMV0_TARER|nr:hypothetical protein QVD17_30258 [Tagetes erecta]
MFDYVVRLSFTVDYCLYSRLLDCHQTLLLLARLNQQNMTIKRVSNIKLAISPKSFEISRGDALCPR